ncbi:MAG: Mbeg1-like protein [Pyrinomonadaceae bacterium]
MSFLDSIRDAGSNVVHGIDNIGDRFIDAGETVVSTAVGGAETVGSTFITGARVTENIAVSTIRFQADMTRAGLERAWNGAQAAGSTAVRFTAAGFDRVTHPGDPNPPAAQGLQFSETKSAAGLAYDANLGEVYRFPNGKQWQVVDVQDDSRTGFRAIALKSTDPNDERVIVAYAGSRDGRDWRANIGQGLGLPTRQYRQAVEFAEKWEATSGGNVILTGHSLGGGLASYASIKTGLRATAVNSAPLALDHLGFNPLAAARITQYYVPGEALSVLNRNNPLDIRPGNGIAVQGRYSIFDPRSIGRNHALDAVAPDIPAPVKVR